MSPACWRRTARWSRGETDASPEFGTGTRRPEAQELFTDRVAEQERLKQLFDALCAERVDRTRLFLASTALAAWGRRRSRNVRSAQWRSTPHAADTVELRFAECDVDAPEFTPDYGIMEFFVKELRPALKRAGFQLALFDIYYCAWRGKSKPDEPMSRENLLGDLLGVGERSADTAAPLVTWLGALGNSIRGIDLVLKATTAIRDWRRKQRVVENFPDLDLNCIFPQAVRRVRRQHDGGGPARRSGGRPG